MTLTMLAAPPLPAAHKRAEEWHENRRTTHDDVWDMADACLEQTATVLRKTRAVSATELAHAIALTRASHAKGEPADLLEMIAKIQGHAEEHLNRVILDLGNKVASALSVCHPLIPFVDRLLAPSAFYDSFNHIHKSARVLLSPVIYAEDTDAIGTASVNPVAAALLAEEIRTSVFKRFGIRPFVTACRLDYESWTFLARKHFEL